MYLYCIYLAKQIYIIAYPHPNEMFTMLMKTMCTRYYLNYASGYENDKLSEKNKSIISMMMITFQLNTSKNSNILTIPVRGREGGHYDPPPTIFNAL